MQTINLEFKKLDKLPVPESQSETLYIKETNCKIYSISADLDSEGLGFDAVYNYAFEYAHVKVTAAGG